jgi:hypothetical protein
MKRALLIVLAIAAVLLISSCSLFQKTYYQEVTSGTAGICEEISTSDADLTDALIAAGYALGKCSEQGYSGAASCTGSSSYGGTAYDWTDYFNDDYLAAFAGSTIDAQAICEAAGGVYKP